MNETEWRVRLLVHQNHKSCRKFSDKCESGCGPASHTDREGVPLCCYCAESLAIEQGA